MPVVAAPTTELMPRMEMFDSPEGFPLLSVSPGVSRLMSWRPLMLCLSSAAAPSAATLIGTLVMTVSRRCAVTTTVVTCWSESAAEAATAGAGAGAACDHADDTQKAPAARVNRAGMRMTVLTRNSLMERNDPGVCQTTMSSLN